MIYWIDSLVPCLKDTETCVVKVPKFMQGDTLSAGNNSAPDPYSEPPVSRYNLRSMVNYAPEHMKKNIQDKFVNIKLLTPIDRLSTFQPRSLC